MCRICTKCSSQSPKEQKRLQKKWAEKRIRDKKHRDAYKLSLIKLKGGKCQSCGLKPSKKWPVECFDFHHLKNKNRLISRLMNARKSREIELLNELKACQVLCANCHRARTAHAYEEKRKKR
jgi:hypothetical protein